MAAKRRLNLVKSKVGNYRPKIGDFSGEMRRQVILQLQDNDPKNPLVSRAKKMVELRREKAAKLMAGYYTGTLRSLQGVLDNPGTSVWLSPARLRFYRKIDVPVGNHGSKMKQTEQVRLESGSTTFTSWEGLSARYANAEGRWSSLPKSRNIWRKTGKLRDAYNAWFASQQSRLGNPKEYFNGQIRRAPGTVNNLKIVNRPASGYVAVPGMRGYVSSSTKQIISQWSFTLKHPRLSSPLLDIIIRDPYVTGTSGRFDAKINRDKLTTYVPRDVVYSKGKLAGRTIRKSVPIQSEGLSRMGLAEARRPMISRFAKAAGEKELAAMRKLLKR